MAEGARTHFRTCHLCEAICGIAIELDGERVHDDPRRRGGSLQPRPHLPQGRRARGRARGPGPAAPAAARATAGPLGGDRLGRGARRGGRRGSPRSSAPWPRRGGRLSRQPDGPQLLGRPLRALLSDAARHAQPSTRRPRWTSCPHACSAALLMFGHQLLLPIPDLDRTDFLLVLGANPAVSNGSVMTAPGRRAARCRRSASAAGGSWWWTRGAPRRPSSPTRTSSSGRARTRCCSPRS